MKWWGRSKRKKERKNDGMLDNAESFVVKLVWN